MRDSPPRLLCGIIGDSKEDKAVQLNSKTENKVTSIDKSKSHGSDAKPLPSAYYFLGKNYVAPKSKQRPTQMVALEAMYGSIDNAPISIDSDPNLIDHEALPFTREEFTILNSDDASNDIKSAVIWHAVEREQVLSVDQQKTTRKPPSSAMLVTRLFRSKVFGDEVPSTLRKKSFISDDDAVIIHAIDALFIHYMQDANKIDPFDFSECYLNLASVENTSLPINVQKYFKTFIAESSNTSCKLRVGHKITSSLLTWASHMHLNSRNRLESRCQLAQTMDDVDSMELPSFLEFMSDIMRLLAARWREAAEMNGETVKKKKQTKTSSSKKTESKPKQRRQNGKKKVGTRVTKTKTISRKGFKRPAHWKKPGRKPKKKLESNW